MLKGFVCFGGVMGALKYVVIGVVVVVVLATALVLLPTLHRVPVQYVGSPGYEAFVPNGQTINYDGHTDPEGELILNNGTIIHNVIWDGQYANTIIKNDNEINELNGQFVGQTDPINNQPYGPLKDFYVIDTIKSQVPIQQATIDGQTYYVIEANKINSADIAGFYTYQGWVTNFVEAMNTPGTYAAVLPGNSSLFQQPNTPGTVAEQTIKYEQYGLNGAGRHVLVLPNETIIPYGAFDNIAGSSLNSYIVVQQVYNSSS
jgi:hypothetical protein